MSFKSQSEWSEDGEDEHLEARLEEGGEGRAGMLKIFNVLVYTSNSIFVTCNIYDDYEL